MSPSDNRAGPISVRVLGVALVLQLLLGGAFIWAAATGFSFLEGGATVTPRPPARRQTARPGGAPACRELAPSTGAESARPAPLPRRPTGCVARP